MIPAKMSARTPGPYYVDMESQHFMWTDSISIGTKAGDGGHVCHLTRGLESDENGGTPAYATAAFIVTACNAYDADRALIAALVSALRAYVLAQSRMLDKWTEGDENVKRDLWRNLHACEDAARAALSRAEKEGA